MSRNLLIFVGAICVLAHCNRSEQNSHTAEPASAAPATSQIPANAYFTPENPGKWKDRAPEHKIEVRNGRIYSHGKKKLRELNIHVPLEGDDRHYLEAGVAMDHSLKKEYDKVTFAPRTAKFDFKLTVPADTPNAVFVIIKCNQHDMWLSRVEPLPAAQ